MSRTKLGFIILGAVATLMLPGSFRAAENTPSGVQAGAPPAAAARDLFVTVGKSLVVESPVNIERISVGEPHEGGARRLRRGDEPNDAGVGAVAGERGSRHDRFARESGLARDTMEDWS